MHWLNRKKTFGEKKRDSGRICLAQIAIKKKEALGRPHPWALARFREEGWLGEEGCAGPAKKQAGPGACLGGQKGAHTWSGRSELGWIYGRRGRPVRAKQGSDAVNGCGRGARLPRDSGGAILVVSTGRRVAQRGTCRSAREPTRDSGDGD